MTSSETGTSKKDSLLAVIAQSSKWPFAVGAGGVVLALSILFHFEPKALWAKVLAAGFAEIGFAFIIAYIVSVTVEHQARREFTEMVDSRQKKYEEEVKEREIRLSKNIFDYIYSIKLDKNVFDFIEESIFRKPFYRRDMKIEYEFGEIIGDWVLMRCDYEFKVENISATKQVYDLDFFTERPKGDVPPTFEQKIGLCKFYCRHDRGPEGVAKADAAAQDDEDFYKFFHREEIEVGESVEFRFGFYLPKRLRDAELWRTGQLCDGLTVVVRRDPALLDVTVLPVHPKPFKRHDEEDHRIVVRIDEPLLPKNGVYLYWTKILDANPMTSVVARTIGVDEPVGSPQQEARNRL